MVVRNSMLYLTIWIIQGIANILFKIFLICIFFFLVGSANFILSDLKTKSILILFVIQLFIIYLSQPSYIFFIYSLILLSIFFTLLYKKINLTPKISFWILLKESLSVLITIREFSFIPDKLYFFLSGLKNYFLIFLFFLFFILFSTYHHLVILSTLIFTALTAIFIGLSIKFFTVLIFSSNSEKPDRHNLIYSLDDKKNTPIFIFTSFLKKKIDSHPLNAIVEETFFEDNLQIGEFFLVYPIFFKASPPSPYLFNQEEEILKIWHLIRWESALSKQSGSAASRWFSLFDLKSSYMRRRVNSIHTPLIPVYRDELFQELKSFNLPCFDPFNQPPLWSPYLILTSILNWETDQINEERLNEIEEEEWQCSLFRTSSLHLDRGIPSP